MDGSPRKASKTFPSQGPSPTLLKDGRVPHGSSPRAERHLWNRRKHSPRKAPKDSLRRALALTSPSWRTDGSPRKASKTFPSQGPSPTLLKDGRVPHGSSPRAERHLWNRLKHSPRKAPKDSLRRALALASASWRTDGSPRKASKTFPSQGPSPTLLKDGRVT